MRDPYDVLGVRRDAPPEEIKRSYRKLAKSLHPDLNPGKPEVERRFKEVSAAYDLLSDSAKRARFDRGEIDAQGNPRPEHAYREAWGRRGRAGAQGGPQGGTGAGGGFWGGRGGGDAEFGGFDPSAIFEEILGGGRRRGGFRARGGDVAYSLTVDFLDAALGAKRRVTLSDGQTLDIAIPPGTETGQTLRLKGKGMDGLGGGEPGDALIQVTVGPHKLFRREGFDIHIEAPVSVQEAVLGAGIEVPTIDGRVAVKLPKGADTGTRLRLKGRGVPRGKGGARGDQY
ncbi:MAG: DnaJ C-terminal domain-containing protein, partial [Rhodospirillales bacterium]